MQKEIIDVLKENGIQNDVDVFLSQANAFLDKSKNLSGVSLFGGENPDYTMTDLIGVLSMANRVKENKNQYNTAVTRLKDEDAGQEVALTSNGQVYVYNKDEGLKTISSSDYYKNRDKYQLLTNSQVLGLRENSPELTFNDGILKKVYSKAFDVSASGEIRADFEISENYDVTISAEEDIQCASSYRM